MTKQLKTIEILNPSKSATCSKSSNTGGWILMDSGWLGLITHPIQESLFDFSCHLSVTPLLYTKRLKGLQSSPSQTLHLAVLKPVWSHFTLWEFLRAPWFPKVVQSVNSGCWLTRYLCDCGTGLDCGWMNQFFPLTIEKQCSTPPYLPHEISSPLPPNNFGYSTAIVLSRSHLHENCNEKSTTKHKQNHQLKVGFVCFEVLAAIL